MVSRKRSQRLDKLAQLYDSEILPVWAERFGRMLLRDLPIPTKGQILDVACGTGYPAVEIIRRMGPGARLIAIDPVSVMLDEARKKVEAMGARSVFFRTESAEPKLSFADGVYDLVVCNLSIANFEHPAAALADFARVTRPSGHVRCTLPLAGSFQEFYDIYREVLTKHDKHQTLENLEHHLETYATPQRCESWLKAANLVDGRVEFEEFTMLFRSSREFFFAPVIEYGPLSAWKALAGRGQEMQDVFWYIKEAIDAYFEGRAFEVTVKAGCIFGNVADEVIEVVEEELEEYDPHGDLTLKVPTAPPWSRPKPVPRPAQTPEPKQTPEHALRSETEPTPTIEALSSLSEVRHSFQDHEEVTSPGGPQGNANARVARPADDDRPRASRPIDIDGDDDDPIYRDDVPLIHDEPPVLDNNDVFSGRPNTGARGGADGSTAESGDELETLDRGKPIRRAPAERAENSELSPSVPDVPQIGLDAFDSEAPRPLPLEDSATSEDGDKSGASADNNNSGDLE